jgi:hypothetical protein
MPKSDSRFLRSGGGFGLGSESSGTFSG